MAPPCTLFLLETHAHLAGEHYPCNHCCMGSSGCCSTSTQHRTRGEMWLEAFTSLLPDALSRPLGRLTLSSPVSIAAPQWRNAAWKCCLCRISCPSGQRAAAASLRQAAAHASTLATSRHMKLHLSLNYVCVCAPSGEPQLPALGKPPLLRPPGRQRLTQLWETGI